MRAPTDRPPTTLGGGRICLHPCYWPCGHNPPIHHIQDLSSALTRVRPHVIAAQRRRQGCKQPDVDTKAFKHDKTLLKTLLDTLCTLAQDRLISIFQNNRTKEIRALDPNRTCPPFRPRAGMSGSKAPLTK